MIKSCYYYSEFIIYIGNDTEMLRLCIYLAELYFILLLIKYCFYT